jgi:hypothetical protein
MVKLNFLADSVCATNLCINNFIFDGAINYFTLGSKRAFFIPENYKTVPNSCSSVVITALKVVSYMTIVIPLLMLGIVAFIPRFAPQTPQIVLPNKGNKKTYCFGDIHGELNGFRENLEIAKVVDQNGDWRAGNSTTIVQMGDVIDRGPYSVEAYQYLGKIQQQAQQHSEKVIRLLGNHELMLIMGNWSYANFNHCDQLAAQIERDIIEGKVQAAYYDGKYLYVHGGLRSSIRKILIEEIIAARGTHYTVTEQDIADHINHLIISAVKNGCFTHPIFYAGRSRGGDQNDGGVFWSDFQDLLLSRCADEIPQIVGHTVPQSAEPPIRHNDSFRLVNVDAGLCQCYGGRRAFIKVKDASISIYQKLNNIWNKRKRML